MGNGEQHLQVQVRKQVRGHGLPNFNQDKQGLYNFIHVCLRQLGSRPFPVLSFLSVWRNRLQSCFWKPVGSVAVASSLQNHRGKKTDGWDRKTSGGHSIPKRWKPWKSAPDAHAYHPESTWQSSTSCNHRSNENLVLKIFQYPYRRWHHLTWWQHFFFLVLVFFVLFKLLLTNGAVGSRSAPRSTIQSMKGLKGS